MRQAVSGRPLKRWERVGPAELAVVERGPEEAPPVVFLHGFPTHAFLWRKVLDALGDDVHALAPDLPGLGDTLVSPYEDVTAPTTAERLVEWLDRRRLGRVAVVAHDQGAAVAQQLVATFPERVSHLALVDAVAYDNWPVPLVASMMRLARWPGLDTVAYALDVPRRLAHSSRVGFARAVHDRAALPPEVIDEYLRPLSSLEGRERARHFLLAGDARFTLECVPGLRSWPGPAVVVWGADDAFLSPSWGVRLAADLPGAGPLELIPFCGHLVPEERPEALAAHVRALLRR